jgi:hypothetical protein
MAVRRFCTLPRLVKLGGSAAARVRTSIALEPNGKSETSVRFQKEATVLCS